MTPSSPNLNPMYLGRTYPKFLREFVAAIGGVLYCLGLRFGDLRLPLFTTDTGSPLSLAISHILKLSPQEKMIDVAARRVVAPVTYKKTLGYWTVGDCPCKTMGKPSRNTAPRAIANDAMTRLVNLCARPFKASICTRMEFRKEPLFERYGFSHVSYYTA